MVEHITLECTECGDRSYLPGKNKRKHPKRLTLKRYCSVEGKVTLHRETK